MGRGRRLQGDPAAARGRKSERKDERLISLFFLFVFFFLVLPDDDKGRPFFLLSDTFFLQTNENQQQFIGTFSTIQEMEDFGELDAALGRPKK